MTVEGKQGQTMKDLVFGTKSRPRGDVGKGEIVGAAA